jgi:hypothetical protein
VVNRGRKKRFALMAEHPQIYMDVSTINWIGGPAGRPAFHAFLKQAIDRGLEKRISLDQSRWDGPTQSVWRIAGVDSAHF